MDDADLAINLIFAFGIYSMFGNRAVAFIAVCIFLIAKIIVAPQFFR